MNEMMATFNQIEKDLAFIKEKRNIISTQSDDPEISKSRKDQIIQDVQSLAKMIEENRQKLASLNKRLKDSGFKITSLEKQVEDLNNSLSARDVELASLKDELEKKNYEISNLSGQVATLENTRQQNEQVITQQTSEINDFNKAYYTLGTAKELKEKGLITKEGGFLGLGKTKIINTGVGNENFAEIDIRNTKSIPVNSKEVKLITEHPAGSYEFVNEGEKVAALNINNPEEFYKFSKYIVLEIQ
jgi:DNA repair exonuclease SbcCD ATPase subunit